MLKKYLQALLEAFIDSKKEWIVEQTRVSQESVKYSFVGGDYENIVAPFTGYVWATTKGTPSKISKLRLVSCPNGTNDLLANSANKVPGSIGTASTFLPVKKGENIQRYGENGLEYDLYFVKSIGSV